MTAEEYGLIGGPLDGCTFSLDTDHITNQPCVMAPQGQGELWLVASFDEGGDYVRFLIGERQSTHWNVHQYRLDQPGKYKYAGVLIRSDGKARTEDVLRKLKGSE